MFANIWLRFGLVRAGWVRDRQGGWWQYTSFYGAFSRLCHLGDLCAQFSEKAEAPIISGPITIFLFVDFDISARFCTRLPRGHLTTHHVLPFHIIIGANSLPGKQKRS